ncbi:helix-turn-helix transcriptional regulator [Vagococcus xieshaowenii]
MKKENLHFYQSLTHFLGKTLGKNFEVVLHILEKDNYHIAAIENSHISGRSLNSPVTEFALELIQDNRHLDKDYVVNYKAQTVNGQALRGATFFIKNEDKQLEGLLCINQDVSKYEQLSKELLALAGLTQTCPSEFKEEHLIDTVEVLDESIEDIVHTIIKPELLTSNASLSKEQTLDVIHQLNEKGIFQIKGAVMRVADILNISEPSVYRYIKIVNDKEKG